MMEPILKVGSVSGGLLGEPSAGSEPSARCGTRRLQVPDDRGLQGSVRMTSAQGLVAAFP